MMSKFITRGMLISPADRLLVFNS